MPLFDCIIRRQNRKPVHLLVPRQAEDIERLRAQGYQVDAVPIASPPASPAPTLPRNEHRPTPYSEALVALTKLYTHCEAKRNVELQARTMRALGELLRGSGLSPEETLRSTYREPST